MAFNIIAATNLQDDSTNVEVSSLSELKKLIKLVGEYNLYISAGFEFETVGTMLACYRGFTLEGLFE